MADEGAGDSSLRRHATRPPRRAALRGTCGRGRSSPVLCSHFLDWVVGRATRAGFVHRDLLSHHITAALRIHERATVRDVGFVLVVRHAAKLDVVGRVWSLAPIRLIVMKVQLPRRRASVARLAHERTSPLVALEHLAAHVGGDVSAALLPVPRARASWPIRDGEGYTQMIQCPKPARVARPVANFDRVGSGGFAPRETREARRGHRPAELQPATLRRLACRRCSDLRAPSSATTGLLQLATRLSHVPDRGGLASGQGSGRVDAWLRRAATRL